MAAMAKAISVRPRSIGVGQRATVSVAEGCSATGQKVLYSTVPKPSGEQQGGPLPHDAAHSQNTAGDDPVHCSFGSTTVRTICHLPAPSASAPSR